MRIVRKLRREGRAVIAPFNREEVAKRAGNSREYQSSAESNISLGLFLGYSAMPLVDALIMADRVTRNDELDMLFTLEFPLYISEGGHRSRWLDDCEDNDAPIGISILVGDNAEAVEEKAKEEYRIVNTSMSALNAGEIQRALPTDPQREIIRRMFMDHINEFCPETKAERESRSIIINALINTLETGNFSKLHTKKSTVDDTREIEVTPETTVDAQVIVSELDRVRNHLTSLIPSEIGEPQSLIDARNAFRDAPRNSAEKEEAGLRLEEEKTAFKELKKTRKALQKKNSKIVFDLDLYGPILYGLYGAHDAGDISTATQTINRWFEKCVQSPEEWDTQFREVMRSTSTARSYTEDRYRIGWNKICEAANES